MSTSLQHFPNSYPQPPMSLPKSQTPGLDTLAEGSQYALEKLQLSREAAAASNPPSDDGNPNPPFRNSSRDPLADARSSIRKNSSGPVRRRISRACDQCNQLRTKCDGQNPCAHCLGTTGLPASDQCYSNLPRVRVDV